MEAAGRRFDKNPGMGILVPAEFPMSSLKNHAERNVVQASCDRLTDSWLVLPAGAVSGDARDRETKRDGLTLAATTQVAADLLTGSGRMPSEGEELIAWMKDNERVWRT